MKRLFGLVCLGFLVLSLPMAAMAQEDGAFIATYNKWKDQTIVVPNLTNIAMDIPINGHPMVLASATFKGDKATANTLIESTLRLYLIFHTRQDGPPRIGNTYCLIQDGVFFVDGQRRELHGLYWRVTSAQVAPGRIVSGAYINAEYGEFFDIPLVRGAEILTIKDFAFAKVIEVRFNTWSKEHPYIEFVLTPEDTKYLRVFLDLYYHIEGWQK